MSRFAHMVVVVIGCFAAGPAKAELLLDLPGLASGIPAESIGFSILNYRLQDGSVAKLTDVAVSRTVDAHSPNIVNAALLGTLFPTATIKFCKGACSSATDHLKYVLEDALVSSYMTEPGGDMPQEVVSLSFSKIDMEYKPDPTPPRTAWGAVLPPMLPAGGHEPYNFDVVLNEAAAESVFDRPLSPLGDILPDTLLNISAVPEPSTLLMLIVMGFVTLPLLPRGTLVS